MPPFLSFFLFLYNTQTSTDSLLCPLPSLTPFLPSPFPTSVLPEKLLFPRPTPPNEAPSLLFTIFKREYFTFNFITWWRKQKHLFSFMSIRNKKRQKKSFFWGEKGERKENREGLGESVGNIDKKQKLTFDSNFLSIWGFSFYPLRKRRGIFSFSLIFKLMKNFFHFMWQKRLIYVTCKARLLYKVRIVQGCLH